MFEITCGSSIMLFNPLYSDMGFPIHIDTVSIGLSIIYFKGSKVEFVNYDVYLSLEVV